MSAIDLLEALHLGRCHSRATTGYDPAQRFSRDSLQLGCKVGMMSADPTSPTFDLFDGVVTSRGRWDDEADPRLAGRDAVGDFDAPDGEGKARHNVGTDDVVTDAHHAIDDLTGDRCPASADLNKPRDLEPGHDRSAVTGCVSPHNA